MFATRVSNFGRGGAGIEVCFVYKGCNLQRRNSHNTRLLKEIPSESSSIIADIQITPNITLQAQPFDIYGLYMKNCLPYKSLLVLYTFI